MGSRKRGSSTRSCVKSTRGAGKSSRPASPASPSTPTSGTLPPIRPRTYAKAHRAASPEDAENWVTAEVSPTLNPHDSGAARAAVLVAAVQDSQSGVREYQTAGRLRANGPGTQPTGTLVSISSPEDRPALCQIPSSLLRPDGGLSSLWLLEIECSPTEGDGVQFDPSCVGTPIQQSSYEGRVCPMCERLLSTPFWRGERGASGITLCATGDGLSASPDGSRHPVWPECTSLKFFLPSLTYREQPSFGGSSDGISQTDGFETGRAGLTEEASSFAPTDKRLRRSPRQSQMPGSTLADLSSARLPNSTSRRAVSTSSCAPLVDTPTAKTSPVSSTDSIPDAPLPSLTDTSQATEAGRAALSGRRPSAAHSLWGLLCWRNEPSASSPELPSAHCLTDASLRDGSSGSATCTASKYTLGTVRRSWRMASDGNSFDPCGRPDHPRCGTFPSMRTSPMSLTGVSSITVRTSPSPGSEPASPGSAPASSLSSSASQPSLFGPEDTYSLRTSPVSFRPMGDGTFVPSSGRFGNAGFMTSPTRLLTAVTSEFRRGGGASTSLVDVLEDSVPERYYLSPRAARGILRRAATRGKEIPAGLAAALRATAEREESPVPSAPPTEAPTPTTRRKAGSSKKSRRR